MIIIIILLIILYYIINYNSEYFKSDINQIYDKNNYYLEKVNNCHNFNTNKNTKFNTNTSKDTNINNFINNSIFIDDRILAFKNKNNKINIEYILLGYAINPYNNIKYLLYEKYYKNNLFNYLLINKNNIINNLPPREKICLNDIIYIKNSGHYKIII